MHERRREQPGHREAQRYRRADPFEPGVRRNACTSLPQTPQEATRSNTSPGPGFATETSLTPASPGPWPVFTKAFTYATSRVSRASFRPFAKAPTPLGTAVATVVATAILSLSPMDTVSFLPVVRTATSASPRR